MKIINDISPNSLTRKFRFLHDRRGNVAAGTEKRCSAPAGCELEVPPRKKHGGGYCRSSCRRAAHAVTRMLLSCLDHLYGTDLIGVSLSSGKITNRLVGVFVSYTCGFPSAVRGSCFSGTVYWFESQSKLVF